jgi:hypothetical protein
MCNGSKAFLYRRRKPPVSTKRVLHLLPPANFWQWRSCRTTEGPLSQLAESENHRTVSYVSLKSLEVRSLQHKCNNTTRWELDSILPRAPLPSAAIGLKNEGVASENHDKKFAHVSEAPSCNAAVVFRLDRREKLSTARRRLAYREHGWTKGVEKWKWKNYQTWMWIIILVRKYSVQIWTLWTRT